MGLLRRLWELVFGPEPPMPAPMPPTPKPTPEPEPDSSIAALLDLLIKRHNDARSLHQLRPLRKDNRLMVAAREHGEWMAKQGKLSHSGSWGSSIGTRVSNVGFKWSTVGENIAFGQSTVDHVMRSWEASPGHRANILSSQFTDIGVAITYDKRGQRYWCAVFARSQ